tara:strand:- start:10320 stop:12671 length:2352 start_codon:yes stop_codon:yes gene_type:complete
MANLKNEKGQGPIFLRHQAGSLILSNEIAQEILNMRPTQEGTLRSIIGPATYVPLKTELNLQTSTIAPGTQPPSTDNADLSGRGIDNNYPIYGKTQHGIFHAHLHNTERSILLLHTGDELWEFRGWKRNWRKILSPTAGIHGLRYSLYDDTSPRFPTQFENTGNGIVIVPQEGRSFFYDGHTIAPLGFTEIPTTPMGRGPGSTNAGAKNLGATSGTRVSDATKGVNNTNYAHSGLYMGAPEDNESGMTHGFGKCRIGTTNPYVTDVEDAKYSAGMLDSGEWRCRVQFVDKFGNLSALSEPSDPVTIDRQGAETRLDYRVPFVFYGSSDLQTELHGVNVDHLRVQIAWAGIPRGPDHCIGRLMYRTKDLINSGTAKYFSLPLDTSPTFSGFGTLPDNVTTVLPDNIPDSFLGVEAVEIAPVPLFRICRVAFGRLFVANMVNDESKIQYSRPGQWGTFERNAVIRPDSTGGQITGLWRSQAGLLAFSELSTFLIQASSDGMAFQPSPVSHEVGCSGPNSIQTLPDGSVIWLSSMGFFTYDGQSVAKASSSLNRLFKRFTKSRLSQAVSALDIETGEYRCWVSIDGSQENNLCVVYDGSGWRTRNDVLPRDVCVTQDHRSQMLIAGAVANDSGHNGVYVLDRMGNRSDAPLAAILDDRSAVIETSWLQAPQSMAKKSNHHVYLWFRESEKDTVKVEVMRDWSERVIETLESKRYSTIGDTAFWGETVLGESNQEFRDRRPYWTRAQIYLPSSETYKFRISGSGFWEFMGISFDESPRFFGGAQLQG